VRRFVRQWLAVMVVAVLGMVMVSEVSSLAATPSKHLYKNCGQLRQNFYPDGYFGVARGWAVVGSSMAVVNRKVYIANIRLDFDGDGIICERENIQNPPTTTTTTTTTPSTPVPNLANFVGQYGKSVVTVIAEILKAQAFRYQLPSALMVRRKECSLML